MKRLVATGLLLGLSTLLYSVRAHSQTVAVAIPQDLSPLGMYLAADWVVKLVMISLIVASFLTWSVCVYKAAQLLRARRQECALLAVFLNAKSLEQAQQQCIESNLAENSAGQALLQAVHLEQRLTGATTDLDGLKERVSARLDRIQLSYQAHLNRGLGVVATVGSVAPFVGLFGTVWGIMNSFVGIAESQTTNLAVVAPGIAEALLATAIGLVAAIPAVVIYNHFARSLSGYRTLLGDSATALLILLSRDLSKEYQPNVAVAPVVRVA